MINIITRSSRFIGLFGLLTLGPTIAFAFDLRDTVTNPHSATTINDIAALLRRRYSVPVCLAVASRADLPSTFKMELLKDWSLEIALHELSARSTNFVIASYANTVVIMDSNFIKDPMSVLSRKVSDIDVQDITFNQLLGILRDKCQLRPDQLAPPRVVTLNGPPPYVEAQVQLLEKKISVREHDVTIWQVLTAVARNAGNCFWDAYGTPDRVTCRIHPAFPSHGRPNND